MRLELQVFVPGPIDEVFDFLDDPWKTIGLGGHAAEHVRGITEVAADEDGRRTFEIKMQAGPRSWNQTVQQVVRERPTRLVTEGWTWVNDRDDPALRVTTDRRLVSRKMDTPFDDDRLRAGEETKVRSSPELAAAWPNATRASSIICTSWPSTLPHVNFSNAD